MKEKTKTSIFKKLFGQNSCCCSFQVEENDKEEDKVSANKNETPTSSCCFYKTEPNGSTLKK